MRGPMDTSDRTEVSAKGSQLSEEGRETSAKANPSTASPVVEQADVDRSPAPSDLQSTIMGGEAGMGPCLQTVTVDPKQNRLDSHIDVDSEFVDDDSDAISVYWYFVRLRRRGCATCQLLL